MLDTQISWRYSGIAWVTIARSESVVHAFVAFATPEYLHNIWVSSIEYRNIDISKASEFQIWSRLWSFRYDIQCKTSALLGYSALAATWNTYSSYQNSSVHCFNHEFVISLNFFWHAASHHQSIVPAKTIAPTYHAKNGFMQAKNLSRADEDVYLEIIIPHYINNTENDLNITLNPWCELPGSVVDPLFGSEAQLREITLYALYKCMADHCIYSTNDPNQMLQHMKYHEIMVAIMISQNAELTKRQKSGWLHCAYCNHFADTSQQIVEHTGTTHGSSSFQCSLCFYRSAEIASLEQHQNIFHLNEDQKVLVCPSQPITLDAEHQTMLRNRSKVQKHFVCTQGKLTSTPKHNLLNQTQ